MTKTVCIAIGGSLIVALGFFLFNYKKESSIITGSVAQGSSYQSTTTDSTWNAAAAITGGSKRLSCSSGTLGSVVIHDATAGGFTIYDGTTTLSHALHPTTTLAKVTASQAEGTYTYDSVVNFGILIEFQSSNVASSTITFRGNPICQ